MKRSLFLDLDGTLARFHDEVEYIERMWEKGFFANLKPFENVVSSLKDVYEKNICDIYILSSVIDGEPPYCVTEKNEWLDKYLPFIDHTHRLLVPQGTSKSEFVSKHFGEPLSNAFVLYDDYNKNLREWQRNGGTSIKCINNINNKGKGAYGGEVGNLWEGTAISNCIAPEEITKSFEKSLTSLPHEVDNIYTHLGETFSVIEYDKNSQTGILNFMNMNTVPQFGIGKNIVSSDNEFYVQYRFKTYDECKEMFDFIIKTKQETQPDDVLDISEKISQTKRFASGEFIERNDTMKTYDDELLDLTEENTQSR